MAAKQCDLIYLVSASPLMRHSYESLFRALDREVGSFATIDALFSQFPGNRGCLCIDTQDLDVSLGGCLRLLSKRRYRLPVVLLVGQLPVAYHTALGRLYAPLRLLTKPVSGRRLLDIIETLRVRALPAHVTSGRDQTDASQTDDRGDH
jgi:FixJ family two-component response regulator